MSAERRCLIREKVLLAMAQSERTVRVHPLTQIRDYMLSRSITMQRIEFGPYFGLIAMNERQNDVRKNRMVAVEAISDNRDRSRSQVDALR